MGLLPSNLEAAGFKPTDFDTVLLTHIHPDHSSGLIDTSGKPLFPRAEIIVHEDDLDFWSDPEKRGKSVAAAPYAGSADALLTTYRGRFRPTDGGEVLAGIRQLPLPGHTPGHSGYQLDSAGETLVMWGDTVHVPEIQIPRPQVTSEYDVDEALAHANRRKIFEHVANERLLVTGGHLHLPGFAERREEPLHVDFGSGMRPAQLAGVDHQVHRPGRHRNQGWGTFSGAAGRAVSGLLLAGRRM